MDIVSLPVSQIFVTKFPLTVWRLSINASSQLLMCCRAIILITVMCRRQLIGPKEKQRRSVVTRVSHPRPISPHHYRISQPHAAINVVKQLL